MNCLCCGKPIQARNAVSGWHPACIKRFFGTGTIPEIDISDAALEALATEAVQKGYTVPGVQKKLSLHLSMENAPRLTIVDYPTGYILKPQVPEFSAMPEAEQLVMCMADAAGLSTVPHGLVNVNGNLAYITKRVDRVVENGNVQRLAMEDFCQLDLRLTQDKYRGSYERCARIIDRYSSRKGLDMSELFMRLLFCFLTGNSDMHLKNFSLIETAVASNSFVLSPAYDLLPVNVLMPEDNEQFALTMNGKKTKLRKKDFLIFAEACQMNDKVVTRMINKMIDMLPRWETMCESSLLPVAMREPLIQLMRDRAEVIR